DTLGRIAKRFDTTVDTLVAMNSLSQADRIKRGQVLQVPVQATAAVPEPAPAVREPAKPKEPQRYRVRRGDTLGHIAKRHGTTVDMLVAMNNLDPSNIIKPGQALSVPAERQGRVAVVREPLQPQRPQRYQVEAGDSLSRIAARFDTTVATLAMLNGLSRPYLIMPGQVLDVAQPMPLGRYQVKRGDTLGRVARRFRTTVQALAALNNLRAPYLIRAGQTLVIPGLRSDQSNDSQVIASGPYGAGAPAGLLADAA
ncbi:MAG: LysM peptidoglycan-binding domain-containing protein, partial [Candidatus Tectomicrobia bacterium]|nr:LysM peptidoglycan-binding domain-containing protein [Candidatus Tectomicrobia bacterium]